MSKFLKFHDEDNDPVYVLNDILAIYTEVDKTELQSFMGVEAATVTGTPVRVTAAAHPLLERNVFLRQTPGRTPAVDVAADASPQLKDNVFVGYSEVLRADAARRDQLLQGNLIVGPAPAPASPGALRPGRDTLRRALQ